MHDHQDPWETRIERALSLLADRLDTPPDLHELASAAGISAFHFHRIWRVLTGETVGETIQRLRIAASQAKLAAGGGSVTAVAMDSGFGTPQSFARAFRRVTGMSPSAFAASGSAPVNTAAPADAEVRIELRAPATLVAMRREGGAYRQLNALFWAVWSWAEAAGKAEAFEGIYGIPYDDPVTVPEDRLRYDAAMAFADPGTPEPPLHRIELAAGEHAVLRHVGSYEGLEAANQALVRWLIASGRTPADMPLFHHFLDDPEQTPEAELRSDILILLEPQA